MATINLEKTYLGIELGSTRIKASLIDSTFAPVASGSFEWENAYENGFWTYSLDKVHEGVQGCFADLKKNVKETLGVNLTTVASIGISAMMHGYLAFDKDDNLLVPFRTWRNTTTAKAAAELSDLFNFNIPQRWSISHLYQAILNGEDHVKDIAHINSLAGYVHYLLTGNRELGVGDASGMFPIENGSYDMGMIEKFRTVVAPKNFGWDILDILPAIKTAGEKGAVLTEAGAKFLDPTGELTAGIPVCPPEGDAGTGMVATNAVLPNTGNVSAGTSVFSMLVLRENMKNRYPEIDVVTTPDGLPVAMVHCNNCCGELDAWVNLFGEVLTLFGNTVDKSTLYETLYKNAMSGDCSNVVAYNYLSGEHVTGVENGRPMYFRTPEGKLSLSGFMKAELFSALATLKMGNDIFMAKENVSTEKLLGHGGLFKVPGVGQQILADAFNAPVSVMETAGEGGAWGMAILAAYMMREKDLPLGDWLNEAVFSDISVSTLAPNPKGVEEFKEYITRYKQGLSAQKKAGE